MIFTRFAIVFDFAIAFVRDQVLTYFALSPTNRELKSEGIKAIPKLLSEHDFTADDLLVASADLNMVDAMEILVAQYNVNVNAYSRLLGETPLTMAASRGSSKAVKWLIDHDADVDQKAGEGEFFPM
jgi:ankyrin repeat protein